MVPPSFSHAGVFPFLQLPAELRRRVLSFTNLVVQGKHIVCSIFDQVVIPESSLDDTGCPLDNFRGGYCSLTPLHNFRFCARIANAYSRHCECWFPERSIMRCSKQLYREAMEVFFDMNTFATPWESWLQFRRFEPSARKPRPKEQLQRQPGLSDSASTATDDGY